MKKIYILAAATLALTACDNNDDNQLTSNNALQVTATIGESTLSRAADTSWTVGDRIGISSNVDGLDAPYTNLEYEAKSAEGKFEGKTQMFYYRPMTLTAYYPFAGSEGTVPGDNGVISATTNESAQKDHQPAIDFLWDSRTNKDQKDFSATNPNVNFSFAHQMSKVTFSFISSESIWKNGVEISKGVDVETMIAYDIEKLIVDGTFDTVTGICKADDGSPEEKRGLKMNYSKGFAKDKEPVPSIIIFPQTLPEDGLTLRIFTYEEEVSNIQEYICNLTFSKGEIKPGYHYKYSIQVTRYGLIVGQMSIEEWSDGGENFLTATIDGEEPNFQ